MCCQTIHLTSRTVLIEIQGCELKPQAPQEVFELIPDKWRASYHWINIGVSATKDSCANNPLNMILQHFTPNDFIVIKLDIDAHWIEVPLAKQLLFDIDDDDDSNADGKDHGKDNDAHKLTKLVDTFYFKTSFYGCQNASILEKSFARILT